MDRLGTEASKDLSLFDVCEVFLSFQQLSTKHMDFLSVVF